MRGKNDDKINNEDFSNLDFYEEVHDAKGRYIGNGASGRTIRPNLYPNNEGAKAPVDPFSSKKFQSNNARGYSNVVVYIPRNPAEVQVLIDYLKRKEPAIVNLDKVDEATAQRVLDFISGAVYALNGQIHRIVESSNIFLLTPEGVVITGPID